MPPLELLSGWLLILLRVYSLWKNGTLSNSVSQGIRKFYTQDFPLIRDTLVGYLHDQLSPEVEGVLLCLIYIAFLWLLGWTVLSVERWLSRKSRHDDMAAALRETQDLKKNIKALRRQLKGQRRAKQDSKELKISCKVYRAQNRKLKEVYSQLKKKMETDNDALQADRDALIKKVENMTSQLQKQQKSLQEKLAEKDNHYSEKENNLQEQIRALEKDLKAMTAEHTEAENSYKAQIKELQNNIAGLERSLSSDRSENETLKKTMAQERKIARDDIRALKSRLGKAAKEREQLERTMKEELAQKEAAAAHIREQLDSTEGTIKAYKVQQILLNSEIQQQQERALERLTKQQIEDHETLVAYHTSEFALAQDKIHMAALVRKMEEQYNALVSNRNVS